MAARCTNCKRGLGLLLLLWGAVSPASAQSVAPNLVVPKTPEMLGIMAPAPAPELTPEPAKPAASSPEAPVPAVDGSLEVTLESVAVDGAFEELQGALDTLWSQLKGRRVSMGEVQRAVSEYQQAYEAAGFMLARVITPPQTLTNRGTLRLVVIDGFIETVESAGLPDHLRMAIADRLSPVVGMRHLQAVTMERQLMLLGNMPGLRLRSALAPGTSRGGVRLIIEGVYERVLGSIQVDNRLPRSLGTWETNVSVATNQLLGFGEKLYASGVVSLRSQGQGLPVRALVAGAAAPVGVDGLMVNVEFTDSQSKQIAEAGVPATQGAFRREAFRLSYPWNLNRRSRVDLRTSFERVEQSLGAADFDTLLNHDAYRVLRLGAELGSLNLDGGGGGYQAAIFLSRGLGGRDPAQALASGIPLSRIGASPRFNKIDFSFQWMRALGETHQLALLAHGQLSGGKPLMKSEQLSLEGGTDILAFPAGTFAVDSGAAMRVEASREYGVPLLHTHLKMGLFAAAGHGTLVQPSTVEKPSIGAASIGVSIHSVEADVPVPGSLYFGVECAMRRSTDTNAPKGWSVMATIGTKL